MQNNQAKFKKFISGRTVKNGVRDITACFHPKNIIIFPGVYGMSVYMAEVEKNKTSFDRISQVHQDILNAGIIVFPVDMEAAVADKQPQQNTRESAAHILDTYLHKKALQGVAYFLGNGFYGKYIFNEAVFDARSMSVELIGIDSTTLLDIAEELRLIFQQDGVLVKDYASGAIFLVEKKTSKQVAFSKPKGTKVKAGFSWDNIGKVVDSSGGEYTLIPIGKDKICMVGKDQDHTFTAREVLSLLNVYDKQGNLVNDKKDYE